MTTDTGVTDLLADEPETIEASPVPVVEKTPREPKDTRNRAESLLATRKTKMTALFSGKHYSVAKEIHLEGDQRFETPFGNKGRHGYALVLDEGLEPEEGQPRKFIVGATMLVQIAEEYGVVEVPVKTRKRRTKEQKAADDAAAAEAKAQAKAQSTT